MLQKNTDNISLSTPLSRNNISNYLKANIIVASWLKEIGLSGMFTPPSLDTFSRHVALGMSDSNSTVTNKTKLTIDNTSAYNIQADSLAHGFNIHESIYLILKGDIAYTLVFYSIDHAKTLPIEQKIVKSFRFI